VDVALKFARDHQLEQYPVPVPGPRTPKPTKSTQIPHGSIRVVELAENRGKGGAVTHGMRHVRGEYVLFVDADGASKFEDLDALVRGCKQAEDWQGRAVAIGSRAHLVGSEAVVKVGYSTLMWLDVANRSPSAPPFETSSCTRFIFSSGS
jgi:dolichyl-phosphate beta-glucosyltransferase